MSANGYGQGFGAAFSRIKLQRGLAFGVIILTALIMFEFFNYSTTEYALNDLLGNLTFLGVSWATILAIAFCGVDFAGIARLHTPESGNGQPNETWYLFGAWILAATMNAMLTWWGVSLAIINHSTLGNTIIDRQTLLRIVPIFVAVMVWLIRVLIIGTYSLAGNRLLSQRDNRSGGYNRNTYNNDNARLPNSRSLGVPSNNNLSNASAFRSASHQNNSAAEGSYSRQEPVYTPIQSASSQQRNIPNNNQANSGSNPYAQKSGYNRRS